MSTKIRLKRFGKKRAPFYRVVVVDSRKARDGKAIEEIGLYHPTRQPSVIEIVSERALYWLSVGAQPSDAVRKLLELTGDWGKFKGDANAKNTVEPQPAKLTPEQKIQKAADDAEKLKQAKAKALEEAKKKVEEEARAAEEAAKAEAEAAATPAEDTTTDEAPAEGDVPAETPANEEAPVEATDAPAEEKPAEEAPEEKPTEEGAAE